jgi:hypothetical protein
VVATPGAPERLAARRADTLEEIRLFDLRHRNPPIGPGGD